MNGILQANRTAETFATAETYGRRVRAVVGLVRSVAREARIRIRPDGTLSCVVVDHANVGGVRFEWTPETFETDRDEEYRTAWDVGVLESTLKFARKGRGKGAVGDPVTLTFEGYPGGDEATKGRTVVGVERDELARETRVPNVNPAATRDEPPDVDLSEYHAWEAAVDAGVLSEGFDALARTAGHVDVETDGDGLVLSNGAEGREDTIRMSGSVAPTGDAGAGADANASSKLLLDYCTDFADAMGAARVGDVTLRWGEKAPVSIRFANAEWGLSGEFFLAPRVNRDELDGDRP